MVDSTIQTRLEVEIAEIYQLYPRHLEIRTAKRAIAKAIHRLTKEKEYQGRNLSETEAIAGLKNRVIQYAESRNGTKKEFTPYPATWFNKGRYLEDPEEWNDDKGDSKNEQRVNRNRSAILAGLGISQQYGPREPDLQNRTEAGGNQDVARMLKGHQG